MKKIISLLSVMTISSTAVPTTIAASPYQNKLESSEINYSEKDNLENLNRSKRNNVQQNQLEFINNNFFYKFNINYNSGKKWGYLNDLHGFLKDSIVLIEDWTKYAKNWEEFEKKFPEIKFINFISKLGGQGTTVVKEDLIIPTFLNKNWNGISLLDSKEKIDENFKKTRFIQERMGVPGEFLNYRHISNYGYNFLFCTQRSWVNIRLYIDGKKLMAEHYYLLNSDAAVYAPWAELKYDSIRLIGENADTNPLISLTVKSYNNLKKYIKEKEKEFLLKHEKTSYDKIVLDQEKNVFNTEVQSKIFDIMHNFIQDLLIIENQNKIEMLQKDINNLRTRIEDLEKSSCIDNIFENTKDKTKDEIADEIVGGIFNKISKEEKKPIGVITKNFAKNIAKGTITGLIDCIL